MDIRSYDPIKMEAVILFFICHANNSWLGKTKLLKLIYYADFDHFERYDHPVTGASYTKQQWGPLTSQGSTALLEMEEADRIRCSNIGAGSYTQNRYEPLEQFDPTVLSQIELQTLEEVANRWRHHTREQIVAATHGEAPWLAVGYGENIPYELTYYRNNYGEMELEEEASLESEPEEAIF